MENATKALMIAAAVLVAVLVTFFGLAFGWLDLVWVLLFKHLVLAK